MSEQHSEDIEKFSDLKDEYRYTDSYTAKKGEFDKCLLLFSGGLDTSCMLKWIRERYECDVYTLTLNLGQSEDFSNIKKKAYNLGAKKHFYVD
ncbi:MAG: argininosuccinate synthase domain-containing protein, partial [Candidatus Saccharimonadales bacterium]